MSTVIRFLLSVCFIVSSHVTSAQIAVYDPATGLLDIPSVVGGDTVYTKIKLRNIGGLVFTLHAATLEVPAATPPFASYDFAASVMTIPTVNVGNVNYQNVTLKNIGNFTFTVLGGTPEPAPQRVQAPPRWAEVWTSTDANTRTGMYSLSVVDPAAPNTLLTVDNAIPVEDFALGASRVFGGTYDPATGQVIDPGARFVGFNRGGKLYGVKLDRTSSVAPVPVQMTSETAARSGPILAAQSATGDDAIFWYSVFSGSRYMRLSATGSTAPLLAPSFPGDTFTFGLLGSVVDPDTGALTGLLWYSQTANGKYRLFRTGPDFQTPVSIALYNSVLINNLGDTQARLARGWAFVADGALRRYDYRTGTVSVMLEQVNLIGTSQLHDDDSLLIRTLQAGTPTLMRCVDAATAHCVTLLAGAAVGTASSTVGQTSTHVQIAPNGVTPDITSVRKSDGVVANPEIPAGGILRQWLPGNGNAAGQRLFYWRNTGTRNLVGSVNGDGSDRREFDGTPMSARTLPMRVLAHRIGYLEQLSTYDKLLIRAGVAGNPNGTGVDRLAWLDGATGEQSADLGTVPSKFFNTFSTFPSTLHPYPLIHGNLSSIGLMSDVTIQFQPVVKKLDAFLIGVQPPGILRLSNNVP